MNFEQCVTECAKNQELIQQFDRLAGTNLQLKGAPIELAVDKATGKLNDDLQKFSYFVWEFVWVPLCEAAQL